MEESLRIQTLDLLDNRFRPRRRGPMGLIFSAIVNSQVIARIRRVLTSIFPFVKLRSDVKNVVYMTWLVDVEKVKHFVPTGLKLWQKNGLTPFTILTYRHGSFGPSFLGPLRRLFFSPLQSNWRLYLESPPSNVPQISTVLFLKNIMNSIFYTFGTRVLSDVLATHHAKKFYHKQIEGGFETQIIPGIGSAPQLSSITKMTASKTLNSSFAEVFDSWEYAVEYLSLQDAAISYTDKDSIFAFSEIKLPIDLATIQPLEIISNKFECPFMKQFSPYGEPLCFHIPEVRFLAISEQLISIDGN